jgi:sugar lactone lactonase YvrE
MRLTTLTQQTPRVGEGPTWDPNREAVHWVDILGGKVHTTDLKTGGTTTLSTPGVVGAAARRTRGGFVCADGAGFAVLHEDGRYEQRVRFLGDGIRMNDAKCDPRGRFWAGSCAMDFAAGDGALHLLDADWTYDTLLDGITQPNGMDWSPDGTTFYLIDTRARDVLAFDCDLDSPRPLSRSRTFVHFGPETPGVPDGMTVDAGGDLWIAFWGGGRLLRLDSGAQVVQEVKVPVQQPSSAAFVGRDLDRLCITSATEDLHNPTDQDGAVLLATDLGARGRPVPEFLG